MSQQFGPKIRTDNLVLCLDAYDYKSYQGEPTTNLLSNGDFENNSTSGWSFDAKTDGSWSVISSDKKHGSYCAKLINSTIQTIALWQGFSMSSGETYTISCWIKNVNCPTTPFFNVTNATFDENSLTTITTGVAAGSEWTYVSKTFTTNATGTCNPYIRTSSNSLQGHFLVDDFQVEQKGYATPFVNGTRSTTSTWKDRTMYGNDGDFASTTATRTTHYRNKNLIYPKQNAYIDFNGTTDYITISSLLNSESIGASTNKTIILWLNPDSHAYANGMPFSTGQVGNNRIYYWTSYGLNTWRLGDYTSTTGHGSLPSVGTWYQTALVIDGLNLTAYLNGEEDYTSTYSTFTTQDYLTLGRHGTTSNYYYPGKIGKVLIYNRSLTYGEILSDYRTTKTRFGL